MATISIADNDARVQYTQAVVANTTQLTIDFPFFSLDDINVIVTSAAGVDTTLTRGTGTGTFAVTGTSVDDGYSGGYITLGDNYTDSSTKYTIFRDIDVERTTDFPTSGPFNIGSLNTELDKIFAINQELETKIGRTMKLADSDSAAELSLPNLDTRKGTVLAFNTTTGLPEAGPEIGDVSTIAAITADISTLADIEDGTDATDAIQTVASISSNVTTVAGISSNVSTVAGISSDVSAVASDATDIGTVSTNIANVNAVGGSIASVNTVATNISSVNTNATNISAITTNATNITDIQNASANAASALASKNAAATSESNAATSEANAATSESNAATSSSSASASASSASTSASNAATSESNAASSASSASTSASSAASSATAAAASAAAAATAFDNFDDTYLGAYASNPTLDNDGDALTTGDLYFNTTDNEMRVYDGAQWIAASAATQASLILYEYTATSGQTTFSGADDNAATLAYTADNIQVVMNGVILDPSDYTATNGTSVVLASGAATGDLLNIYAFQSFSVADTVSASAGGTFSANVAITGDLTVGDGHQIGDETTYDNLVIKSSTDESLVLSAGGTGQFIWKTGSTTLDNGSEKMRLTNAGHVGIGTASPEDFGSGHRTLQVEGNSTNGGIVKVCTTSDAEEMIMYVDSSGATVNVISNDPLMFRTNNTERMRINDSGALRFQNSGLSGSGHFEICGLSGFGAAFQSLNYKFMNQSNSSEYMRIDSSGNLLVGTTSAGSAHGIKTVYSSGTVDTNVSEITSTSGTGFHWTFRRGASEVGTITSTSSSTSYNTSSDYRLKENVTQVTGAADRVKALNPVRFNFIADPDTTVDGFLAHEVADVVPEAISGTKDAMRDEEYEVTPAVLDDEGNVVTEAVMGTRSVPDYQGIDQSKLVPLLTAALQEALTKIDDLESRLSALETA